MGTKIVVHTDNGDLHPLTQQEIAHTEKRYQQINGMADQIAELQDVYNDLQYLEESGNTKQLNEDITSGVSHLQIAAETQRRRRKQCTVAIFICMLVITIIVISIVVALSR